MCKTYMYDEGKIAERNGVKMKRRGPVPCETSLGCPKGHWKNAPDLTPGESIIVDLYQSSKATGGRTLTDEEIQSDFLVECFAGLSDIDAMVADNKRRSELEVLAQMIRNRG